MAERTLAASPARPDRPAWSRLAATALAVYALVGGVAGLVGWAADVPRLTDWIGNGISIQPNAALVATCAAIAVLALVRGALRLARAAGAAVALVAGATALQYLTGASFGIDTPLAFGRTWGRGATVAPGRMGPPGTVAWTLLGVALLCAASGRSRLRAFASWLALAPALLATLSIVGYLYGARSLYTVPTLTTIALQTATFVFAIAAGLVLSAPDLPPVRQVTADGIAGSILRRALPSVLLAPIVIGLLRIAGEAVGLYDGRFGAALRTVTEIVLFVGLLGWLAAVVARQERRREASESARRDVDRRLHETLDNIHDGFVAFDADWRFTHVNREAEHILGRSADELLGRDAWELFPEQRGGIGWRELHRAVAEHVAVHFEEFVPALGKWIAKRAAPTPDGGVAAFFQDITAQKQAEAALREGRAEIERELADAKLLQRVSLEIVRQDDPLVLCEQLVDAAVALVRADHASLQRLDERRGPHGELELLAARGFDPRAREHWRWVRPGAVSVCGRALTERQRIVVADVQSCEFLAGTTDLDVMTQTGIRALQTTPLVARGGALVGMLTTHWRTPHQPSERDLRVLDIVARQAADLLERMRYEAEREDVLQREKAARTEAEYVGRMKDEFLATLSHELRTPLNAILGWTSVLRTDIADPRKAAAALDVLERNGRLQAQLIADMLDMSRIVSGKMRLDVQRVDLAEVVAAAVDAVRPAAVSKGLRLQSVVDTHGAVLNGDPARLQQVAWNLLSNAVKFTPKGGRVQVVLARVASHLQLEVADTGEGISAEFLPRIFERFSQADGSASRAHGGLGIGLALVKELVELHGGSVRAASEGVGHGAVFTVELPLAIVATPGGERAPDDAARATIDGASPSVPSPVALDGMAVLLVDDEPDGAVLARRLLEERGAMVLVALSGAEALGLLRETRVDVIVSDVGMPGMDGYQFLGEVRRRGITAPALALTAFARPVDRTRALLSGYQAHLSKPVGAAEFLAAVGALARRLPQAAAPPPATEA